MSAKDTLYSWRSWRLGGLGASLHFQSRAWVMVIAVGVGIARTICCSETVTSVAKADVARAPESRPATRAISTPSSPDARHSVVIRFLEDRVGNDPDDITALNRLAGEYLRRFRLTGDDHDLTLAESTAAQSLRAIPSAQNSMGLAARARAAFSLHEFAAARDMANQLVVQESDKRYPFDILGDSLLELGDYDAAAAAYRKMQEFDDPDSGTEARLARLALIHGDTDQARSRLQSAVDLARQVAPPAPEIVAWCLVQSGQLAFNTGDFEQAEKSYQAALDASPSDWSAVDHLAELRAAQKRFDESIPLYTELVARVPRPELLQALGDVYAAMGKADEAARWHKKAVEKYLAAASAGSAHYYHHLAGYMSDIEPNPTEAVKWARKDMEIRHSVYAHDALAWALYQAGGIKLGAQEMDAALAQGAKDSHILYHASLIYYRAGDRAKASQCLRQAGEVNPKFNEFHIHR